MSDILLIGAGGHARACIDVIELENKYRVAGLVDKEYSSELDCLGYPFIGVDTELESLRSKYENVLICVGQIKNPEIRENIFNNVVSMAFTLPQIRSPKAYISSHAQIDIGTIVMHGVIINANARIGKNIIINNRALIEHDSVIGDHCHVATGAIVNGNVSIGSKTFIGSGAIIKQGVVIGSNCIVGAGVVLKHDIPSGEMIQ